MIGVTWINYLLIDLFRVEWRCNEAKHQIASCSGGRLNDFQVSTVDSRRVTQPHSDTDVHDQGGCIAKASYQDYRREDFVWVLFSNEYVKINGIVRTLK